MTKCTDKDYYACTVSVDPAVIESLIEAFPKRYKNLIDDLILIDCPFDGHGGCSTVPLLFKD